jgi:hypothetical protein
LQPDNQLHATADVKISRFVAKEHGKIRVTTTVNDSLLHLSNGLNIQKLGLGTNAILGAATTKSLKNIPGFLLAANVD